MLRGVKSPLTLTKCVYVCVWAALWQCGNHRQHLFFFSIPSDRLFLRHKQIHLDILFRLKCRPADVKKNFSFYSSYFLFPVAIFTSGYRLQFFSFFFCEVASGQFWCSLIKLAGYVTGVRQCEHITPALRQLHWLPVRRRVHFKTVRWLAPLLCT